jgi:hypothetical protein
MIKHFNIRVYALIIHKESEILLADETFISEVSDYQGTQTEGNENIK